MKQHKSKITIGIPAYNEENYIARAIESAINQSDNIIITDNASIDNTPEICQDYANKYPHITFIRHKENLGSYKNFYSSLEKANTRYFMWLGAHDMISDTYTETLINVLNQQRDAVLAVPSIQYINKNDNKLYFYNYWYINDLMSEDPFKRVYTMSKYIYDCAIIHSVFKTDILKQAWPSNAHFGYDISILNKAISLGRAIHIPSEIFFRRTIRVETNEEAAKRQDEFITGKESITNKPNPYNEVEVNIMKTVKGIPTNNIIKKLYWKSKIKKLLIQRYGKFYE